MPGSDDEFDDDVSLSSSEEIESEDDQEEEDKQEEDDEEEEEEDKQEDDDQEDDDQDVNDDDESEVEPEPDLNQKIEKVVYESQFGGSTEDNDDEDDDEENNDSYLQKFNADINRQYLMDYHPEAMIHNYDEIVALTTVIRDENNNIIDNLHRTLPYLTKYERTRVLGQRAKQINSGAKAFVKVPENVIDGYLIAELELSQKRIPFIIRRPIPGGACEYWKLKDLEIVGF